jgi:hypothetical protein
MAFTTSQQLKSGASNLNLPPTKDEVDADEPTVLEGFQKMAKEVSDSVSAIQANPILLFPDFDRDACQMRRRHCEPAIPWWVCALLLIA